MEEASGAGAAASGSVPLRLEDAPFWSEQVRDEALLRPLRDNYQRLQLQDCLKDLRTGWETWTQGSFWLSQQNAQSKQELADLKGQVEAQAVQRKAM